MSARSGFFRAASYFRTAARFAMGTPVDPRLAAAHQREVDSFRRGRSCWRGQVLHRSTAARR